MVSRYVQQQLRGTKSLQNELFKVRKAIRHAAHVLTLDVLCLHDGRS